MKVTRTLLRDNRDNDQETQGVRINYKDSPVSSNYVSDIKNNLQNIALSRRERSIINPVQIEAIDPTDPTTYKETDAVEGKRPNIQEASLIPGRSSADEESSVSSPSAPKRSGGGGRKGNTFLNKYRGVESDNLKYGDTMPEGAFGIGSKFTDDFTDRYKSTAGDFLKNYSNNLSIAQNKKTYEQNRLKQGEKFADRGEREAVNASGFKQKNVRGSAFSTGKDEKSRPTSSPKPTSSPTSSPSPSSGGGINTSSSRRSGRSTSRSRGGSTSRSRGGSSSSSRSGSTSSRSSSRGASGSSSSRSRGGTGSGRTSTSRSASSASRSRTGRSRSRCDIRTKIDMTSLKNMNLHRDELADVAYFVKELQEIN